LTAGSGRSPKPRLERTRLRAPLSRKLFGARAEPKTVRSNGSPWTFGSPRSIARSLKVLSRLPRRRRAQPQAVPPFANRQVL
jgi:hypothetical protein